MAVGGAHGVCGPAVLHLTTGCQCLAANLDSIAEQRSDRNEICVLKYHSSKILNHSCSIVAARIQTNVCILFSFQRIQIESANAELYQMYENVSVFYDRLKDEFIIQKLKLAAGEHTFSHFTQKTKSANTGDTFAHRSLMRFSAKLSGMEAAVLALRSSLSHSSARARTHARTHVLYVSLVCVRMS